MRALSSANGEFTPGFGPFPAFPIKSIRSIPDTGSNPGPLFDSASR